MFGTPPRHLRPGCTVAGRQGEDLIACEPDVRPVLTGVSPCIGSLRAIQVFVENTGRGK